MVFEDDEERVVAGQRADRRRCGSGCRSAGRRSRPCRSRSAPRPGSGRAPSSGAKSRSTWPAACSGSLGRSRDDSTYLARPRCVRTFCRSSSRMSRETVAWVTMQPRAVEGVHQLTLSGDVALHDDGLDQPVAFRLVHRLALVAELRMPSSSPPVPRRLAAAGEPPLMQRMSCILYKTGDGTGSIRLGVRASARPIHCVTLVPQPASVSTSSSTACSTRPSTMWALATPPSSA